MTFLQKIDCLFDKDKEIDFARTKSRKELTQNLKDLEQKVIELEKRIQTMEKHLAKG